MVMGHPVFSGFIAGVVHTVMGPEHLSTIITFSAFQGRQAFWLGIRWGIGHMGGMVTIAGVFLLLKSGTRFEKYEHCMDYTIGIFLAGFGFYFLYNAHLYFDAEWNPRLEGCACNGHRDKPDENSPLIDDKQRCDVHTTVNENMIEDGCLECSSETDNHQDGLHGQHCPRDRLTWQLVRRKTTSGRHSTGPSTLGLESLPSDWLRQWGACVAGFIQGLACPAGLVGVAFLKSFRPVDMFIFTSCFFATATLSMGLLAMTYGLLTQRVSSKSLARGIYYGSACLSLFLGIAWIYLNAVGSLDKFFGHEQLHSTNGTSSVFAGGHHSSQHASQLRVWMSLLL